MEVVSTAVSIPFSRADIHVPLQHQDTLMR